MGQSRFRSCSSSTGVSAHHGYDDLMRPLFRAVYTGTRPGLTPAIRAGKGWRGRRELAPRCSATQLGACLCCHIDKDMSVTHRSEPQPPPQPRLRQVDAFVDFSRLVVVDMLVHGEHAATGSAMRRRQRRLRQWHRHQRMTVAMALAEARRRWSARRTACHGTRSLVSWRSPCRS